MFIMAQELTATEGRIHSRRRKNVIIHLGLSPPAHTHKNTKYLVGIFQNSLGVQMVPGDFLEYQEMGPGNPQNI